MTVAEMIANYIVFEGEIEIREWTDYDSGEWSALFQDDAWELDVNAWYANVDVAYMFAYEGANGITLCFELVQQ